MPPSGFSKKAVKGILQFIDACYADLEGEVKSGKHKSFRAAIAQERKQLGKALAALHITRGGRLVRRK